jgi:hypothetical protein
MLIINFEYNKLYLKDVLILLPRFHENMVSLLTPILGLHGVNVKEFVAEIENKIEFIDYDIIIPIRVILSKIKTYEIFMETPTVTAILSNFENFTESNLEINYLTIYKVALIKSIYNSTYFFDKRLKIGYKMIRSYLRSLNRNITHLLIYKRKKKQSNTFLRNFYNDYDYFKRVS